MGVVPGAGFGLARCLAATHPLVRVCRRRRAQEARCRAAKKWAVRVDGAAKALAAHEEAAAAAATQRPGPLVSSDVAAAAAGESPAPGPTFPLTLPGPPAPGSQPALPARPPLALLEELLAVQPPPLAMPCLPRMRELLEAGLTWLRELLEAGLTWLREADEARETGAVEGSAAQDAAAAAAGGGPRALRLEDLERLAAQVRPRVVPCTF
jgi:hypothetical protein